MTWPRMDGLRTLELGSPGPMRRELTGLVLAGVKVGTAGLRGPDYEAEAEELEHVGERLVLVGDDGERLGLIEVAAVQVVPFSEVTDEFARSEGEGYENWSQWAAAHRSYWEQFVEKIEDDTPVVCMNFRLIAEEPEETP
jgi:uncharacterized protein YhfF